MTHFRDDALAGRHIVISGGCGAIGLAIVEKLTAHGARVTVNDILARTDAFERLGTIKVDPERVRYFEGDLTDPEVTQRLIVSAKTVFGPVHVALCHAGKSLSSKLLNLEAAQWDDVMAVNVKAAFLLAKSAARSMIKDKTRGHLIFTSSWIANVSWPEVGGYNASKAAMNQLMRSFARELSPHHIRANAVAPGIVDAGMAKKQWDTEPDFRSRTEKAIPLGKMQTLESVSNAFLFLCSDAAEYMTGSVLTVDGGCSLYPLD